MNVSVARRALARSGHQVHIEVNAGASCLCGLMYRAMRSRDLPILPFPACYMDECNLVVLGIIGCLNCPWVLYIIMSSAPMPTQVLLDSQ